MKGVGLTHEPVIFFVAVKTQLHIQHKAQQEMSVKDKRSMGRSESVKIQIKASSQLSLLFF